MNEERWRAAPLNAAEQRVTNVFVLSASQCGSLTFCRACQHATNYTVAHESRHAELGDARLAYPDRHIEVDNLLAWLLGRLEKAYGDAAVYVHLVRDRRPEAEGYGDIPAAFAPDLLVSKPGGEEPCANYVRTVTENIEAFLIGKSRVHRIDIDSPEAGFRAFWEDIGGVGDLDAALREFQSGYDGGHAAGEEAFRDEQSATDPALDRLERDILLLEGRNLSIREEIAALRDRNAALEEVKARLEDAKSRLRQSDAQNRELKSELQAVRSSFTYSVGHAVASNLRSPAGWVRIPFAVPKMAIKHLRTRKKPQSPSKQLKMDDLRFKLQSLGLWDPALAELEEILRNPDDPWSRAFAARELALHQMRQRQDQAYRKALSYIGEARKFVGRDHEFLATLSTSELLCHHALSQATEGAVAYSRAAKRGQANPDVSLAWVNFQPTPDDRVDVVNGVLGQFGISPLALLPDEDHAPYDRLTSAVALPDVAAGPKVSVLIASYEAKETLGTTLRSLQEQTYKNLEILIIDDCSPSDSALEFAEYYAERDARIRVLRMPTNRGAYVARNRGLDEATGEYVTLNDADDWSHPQKIEVQVRFMEENPEVMGCTSQQARAQPELLFTRWTGRGRFIISNISSFMFRRVPVREQLGYWDTVRFSADKELIYRIQQTWGKSAVRHLQTGPLSFQRNTSTSIVADEALGINGFLFGARKEYRDAQIHFHESTADLYYGDDLADRPFPAPAIMLPDNRGARDRHFPVVMASEFRMRGGSVQSCIQEIRATKAAGYRMGLFEMYRYDLGPRTRRMMATEIRDEIDGDQVQVIAFGEEVSCDLLLLRYPPILEHRQRYVPKIDAGQIRVVVNQPPVSDYSANGVRRYHLERCAENLRYHFGKDAVWFPNGPMVREALLTHHADELEHITLSPVDWDNIIDLGEWKRPARTRGPKHKLRIGRHSRDAAVKWPSTARDVLDAYPECDDVEVHVLGGAKAPISLIGRKPVNWTIHEFGAVSPSDFLAELDVFVFLTHPDWVESFPRVVLEAMAVGVPVILPESHRPLFGDRALYATPQTALEVARRLHANPAEYDALVKKASDYVERNYGYSLHARRLREACGEPVSQERAG